MCSLFTLSFQQVMTTLSILQDFGLSMHRVLKEDFFRSSTYLSPMSLLLSVVEQSPATKVSLFSCRPVSKKEY